MTFSCAGIQISDPRLEMNIFIHALFIFIFFIKKKYHIRKREAIRGRDSVLGLHKRTHDPRLQDS